MAEVVAEIVVAVAADTWQERVEDKSGSTKWWETAAEVEAQVEAEIRDSRGVKSGGKKSGVSAGKREISQPHKKERVVGL